MINKYKIIFVDQTQWTVLAHFRIFKLKTSGLFLEHFVLDFID